MNILQVCPRYFPDIGGVETHVQEISERLVRQGHHVEVVCTDPRGVHPSQDCINGVHVRRFRSFAPNETSFRYRENFALPLPIYLLAKTKSWFLEALSILGINFGG